MQEIKYGPVSKGPPVKKSVHRSWLPFHQTSAHMNANEPFLPSIALKGRRNPWLMTAAAAFPKPKAEWLTRWRVHLGADTFWLQLRIDTGKLSTCSHICSKKFMGVLQQINPLGLPAPRWWHLVYNSWNAGTTVMMKGTGVFNGFVFFNADILRSNDPSPGNAGWY